MSNQFLNTEIDYLKGVGPARAELLKKELGIYTFGDLLNYYPFRYIDKSKVYSIASVNTDAIHVQLKGKLTNIQTLGERRSKRLVATLTDDTGSIELVWFKGIKWIAPTLKPNVEYMVFGKPSRFNNKFNISHPDIEPAQQSLIANQINLEGVYFTSEKLSSKGLNAKGIFKIQKNLVAQIKNHIPESLPNYLIEKLNLIHKEQAVINAHAPKNNELLQKALFRLKFEELCWEVRASMTPSILT